MCVSVCVCGGVRGVRGASGVRVGVCVCARASAKEETSSSDPPAFLLHCSALTRYDWLGRNKGGLSFAPQDLPHPFMGPAGICGDLCRSPALLK